MSGSAIPSNEAVVRAVFEAFAASDRAAIEPLIAADFTFTSPLDNRLDRKTFFERCWPNNDFITGYRFVRLVSAGDAVIVTYVGRAREGREFRNTEILTVRDGQVTATEVYFGWNVPHDAPDGGFLDGS